MHVANVLQPVLLDDHPADAKVKKLLAAVYELLIQLNMQSARILYGTFIERLIHFFCRHSFRRYGLVGKSQYRFHPRLLPFLHRR